MITFNPNGGDLGRANMGAITPFEFIFVVPHIASILQELHESGQSNLPFKYGFEFTLGYKNLLHYALGSVKLPPNVSFYEVDGTRLFEIRGASGGIVTTMICYLVTHS